MTAPLDAQQIRLYVIECLHLLYWTFFKPLTFERWTREIHPQLHPYRGFAGSSRELDALPRWRRARRQVYLLNAVLSMVVAVFFVLLYVVHLRVRFGVRASAFLFGWGLGFLALAVRDLHYRKYAYPAMLVLVVLYLVTLYILSFPYLLHVVFMLVFGLILGLVLGLVFSLVGGLVFGLVFGLLGGLVLGLILGLGVGLGGVLVFGLIFGLVFGLGVGLVFGLGVGLGVASLGGGVIAGLITGAVWTMSVLRLWFWLPECLWMMLLWLRSLAMPRELLPHLLPWVPPYFDEATFLPLPWLEHIVVAAYRENPAAALQTVEYLTTSTRQQRAVRKIIIRIAMEVLQHCQTTSDIAVVEDQLAWLPSPPPVQVGQFLPQMLDISQDVRAAREASSFYRQAQLMQKPLNVLRNTTRKLPFTLHLDDAATSNHIMQRWMTILEAAQNELNERATRQNEVPQEYIAGPALEPESADYRFKGRQDLFREVETLVLSAQPTILHLYGGRRTGKTSALRYLPRRIGADVIPLVIDLQGVATATTMAGFAKELARQMVEEARRSRNVRLPDLDNAALQNDPFPELLRWMECIEQQYLGKRWLLCLDEFERLSTFVEETGSHAPLNFLRYVTQHRRQWITLFSGSHGIDELASYWSDYLINAQSLRISYLAEADARELIVCPVQGFPHVYDANTIEEILRLTRCQPYLVQLVCYLLVEHLNREHRMRTTERDLAVVIPAVLERGRAYFREFWGKMLCEDERELLLSLLRGDTLGEQELAVVQKLLRKGVIERKEHGYDFQVPLMRTFVEESFVKQQGNMSRPAM